MPNQKEPIVKYLKVKSHMNRMIRLAREKHIIQISLDDIRQIKETLKYTNLANLPQDYFKAVESVLGKDVKRKRELYAAKYNIDWRFHLDPRDELKKLKKETPITERIKKLLTAEARAEYALPNQELRDKWVNQKIDYEKFIKLNLELFNSIYESITIEENCWQ
jgi:predicted phage-related endonuclease